MKYRRMLLLALFSMVLIFSLIPPTSVIVTSASGTVPHDYTATRSIADGSSFASTMTVNTPQGNVTPTVAAGAAHTVGLKSDGTVVAAGFNDFGQCDVGGWTDIVQVSTAYYHTVGLRCDGTVVAVGFNDHGQCDVGGWTDIVQVSAGYYHTVGLKSDGTVVAAGRNNYGQCDVDGWMDITQVAAGGVHTLGLKADDTVIAVGFNGVGQCDVSEWMGISGIDADENHSVALKTDGTVVALGSNFDGECDVDTWTDIVQVAAGAEHTVGLESDGTVVATAYDVGGWADVVQIAAGGWHSVGLKSDGTVVALGRNWEGQCNLSDWNLVLAMPPSQFVLSISNTAGGLVNAPGEGVFTYDKGTVVDLVAEPEEGYRFVNWTGDVDSIADISAAQTTITIENYYAITANFELEEGLCSLTISSTAGGLVTTPGEGTFVYDEGTVVDLVAEVEDGYHFLNWAGDVDTIANVTTATANITMDDNYSITARFASVEAADVGIKAGDWMKIEYTITGWPAGQPYGEWLKLEFLSIEGTTVDVGATLHMSDGTEQSDTVSADLGEGGEVLGLSGFIISANLTSGDSVYMTGFGDATIEGETTGTYAGARRAVVYTSISQSIPSQDEMQLTYYWDRQTGLLVESSTTWQDMTVIAKLTETNMWEGDPPAVGVPWWVWVIVAVAAGGLVVLFVRRRKTIQSERH